MQQKLYDKNVIIAVKTITIIVMLYRKYFMFQMITRFSFTMVLLFHSTFLSRKYGFHNIVKSMWTTLFRCKDILRTSKLL